MRPPCFCCVPRSLARAESSAESACLCALARSPTHWLFAAPRASPLSAIHARPLHVYCWPLAPRMPPRAACAHATPVAQHPLAAPRCDAHCARRPRHRQPRQRSPFAPQCAMQCCTDVPSFSQIHSLFFAIDSSALTPPGHTRGSFKKKSKSKKNRSRIARAQRLLCKKKYTFPMQSDMADSMALLSGSDSRATQLLTLNLSDLQKSTPQNRLNVRIIKIVVLDPREFMFLHNILKFEGCQG